MHADWVLFGFFLGLLAFFPPSVRADASLGARLSLADKYGIDYSQDFSSELGKLHLILFNEDGAKLYHDPQTDWKAALLMIQRCCDENIDRTSFRQAAQIVLNRHHKTSQPAKKLYTLMNEEWTCQHAEPAAPATHVNPRELVA